MKNKNFKSTGVILVTLVVIGIVSFTFGRNTFFKNSNQPSGEKIVATVHQEPTCGCCGVFASYMKKEGYDVKINDVADISSIKSKLGVPDDLLSCHTTEIAGYVVEGHIPNEVIEKLLNEKPNIKGIGMAGMPTGSPGMPGPKTEDFVIYEITQEGTKGKIFMTI